MFGHNLVAAYRSRADAERARDKIIATGVVAASVRLSAEQDVSTGTTERTTTQESRGFFDWLFGDDVPERDRSWYGENLSGGRTAVSVFVDNDSLRDRVVSAMEECDPIDIDDEVSGSGRAGVTTSGAATSPTAAATSGAGAAAMGTMTGTGGDIAGSAAARGAVGPTTPRTGMAGTTTSPPASGTTSVPPVTGAPPPVTAKPTHAGAATTPTARTGAMTGDGTGRDEVIPVVREDVSVGKRVEERRQRIRAYVVEKPFEQQVTLRDERVVIERRPVSGERTASGPDAMREREFEVVERHEKPVVDKSARVVEEVVVHHEAGEHTETVRDKVRETRVDVDANKTSGPARNDPAAPTPRPGGTPPGNTRR